MIASGILLMALIKENFIKISINLILETITGISILIVSFIGLFYYGSFLYDFIISGKIGNILSGGIVFVLYIIIGIKVASEISSINYYIIGSQKVDK